MRSLFSGISGLKANQVKMDVISNNIANVNTSGYKKSRITFSDLFSETLKWARAPQDKLGGINSSQVGTGVEVASIDQVFTQGSMESTGKNSDVAIDGEGFFVLESGNGRVYTRAGSFDIDGEGYFVHSATGMRVLGWSAQKNEDTGEKYIDPNKQVDSINFLPGEKLAAKATEYIEYRSNLDETAVERSFPEEGELLYGLATDQKKINVKFEKISDTVWNFSIRDDNGDPVDLDTTVAGVQTDGQVLLWEDGSVKDVQVGGITLNTVSIVGQDANADNITDMFNVVRTPSAPPVVNQWIFEDIQGDEHKMWVKFEQGAGETFTWRIYDENNQLVDLNGNGIVDGVSAGGDFGTLGFDEYGNINSMTSCGALGNTFMYDDMTITVGFSGREITLTENISESFRTIPIGSKTVSFEFGPTGDKVSFDSISGDKHSTALAIYDSLGEAHEMIMNFEKLDDNKWRYYASLSDDDKIIQDYLKMHPQAMAGNELTSIEREAIMENIFWDVEHGNTRSGIVVFNELGKIDEAATRSANNVTQPDIIGRLRFSPSNANPLELNLDFAAITQYDSAFTTAARSQDGYEMGMLETYAIGPDGMINGIYSNGLKQAIGKISLAVFYNPGGLQQVSDTMWNVTPNSGTGVITAASVGKAGALQSGYLEMSNVDLAQEFTDMIVAQRGFQANSRSITTADALLQELVNLKR
ncbi:MAG: flagellar hook-basal body complex protein [Candidatus Wallbacteria bacterium]|nr:flagellar hook-basal body complex protein [Candidatus Wallbacteria bacterium]